MNKTNIQTQILEALSTEQVIDDTLTLFPSAMQLEVLGVLNGLLSRNMILYKTINIERWSLTTEGKDIAQSGSHEARVFNGIPVGEGISFEGLTAKIGISTKFGQGPAFRMKWVEKKKNGELSRLCETIIDQTQLDLLKIASTESHSDDAVLKAMKKRNLIQVVKSFSYRVEKGADFSMEVKREETDITAELLVGEGWKNSTFKKYNFDAEGLPPKRGHLHPLLKVRDEFRQIFFELGFSEMPANKYVESSFWNFDALFQPQQHPARDAQDTFFLAEPATSNQFPKEYLERVKKVHSEGGYGSLGWQYDWKIEEAQKLILRTHTTAISSNLLYQLAQEKEFKPVKWFSIDRVFRNETLDATHLAEFHQIEGVIAERGATLGDLMGLLNGFFKKLGIKDLRFKPAYNPYTEPSMEIFAWHEGLDKYVEIGNSGMFRPEVLQTMGFPPDVQVIAYGLSTERPTMIKYGLNNIRDLVGHKLDLDMVSKNPICRLDKD